MLPVQGEGDSRSSPPSRHVVSKDQELGAWSKHIWPAELALPKNHSNSHSLRLLEKTLK